MEDREEVKEEQTPQEQPPQPEESTDKREINEDKNREEETTTLRDLIMKQREVIDGQNQLLKELREEMTKVKSESKAYEELNDKLNDLSSKLPQTKRDEKATITGYYNTEGLTNKLRDDRANREYQEVKANFNLLNDMNR